MSYLNMFRRKPAITRSDWYFAAFQNSSENYATFTRSIHYNLVLERSPGFGSNRSNLSIIILLIQSLSLGFLTLLLLLTCWPIMQKVRRHFVLKFRLLIELLIQVYFTALYTYKGEYIYFIIYLFYFYYPTLALFNFSLTVLFTIAKFINT